MVLPVPVAIFEQSLGDRFKTLPVLIARSYLFMRDRQTGGTMAVVLLAIAIVVVVASALLARRLQPEART